MDPIIKGENFEIVYNLGKSNEYRALRSVSAEIFPEEYIILFGPSGCGKSTLLYCFLGTLPNTYGKLLVKGEDPYTYDAEQLVQFQQRTMGIIYQAFYLIPSLSVLDNVALPLIFAGVSKLDREKRAFGLLKRFGVEKQAYKLPASLSGGQQQRIAVSRALVNDPEILLADEPVGNLDSISTKHVMDMLDDINKKEKKTIILVTHDAKYLPYAHRVFYMKDGGLEREVPNPEKPQIKAVEPGKTIVTEIETLARMYPYSSVDELRVKSIINFLTQSLNFDQLERLEKTVEMVMMGNIDELNFQKILNMRVDEGGIGLRLPEARKMTEKLHNILEQSFDVKRYRKGVTSEGLRPEFDVFIRRLRTDLLDQFEGQVVPIQLTRLEKAISDRVSGLIKKEDFQTYIGASISNGGAGFPARTARNFTLYLEKLIAQGTRI